MIDEETISIHLSFSPAQQDSSVTYWSKIMWSCQTQLRWTLVIFLSCYAEAEDLNGGKTVSKIEENEWKIQQVERIAHVTRLAHSVCLLTSMRARK